MLLQTHSFFGRERYLCLDFASSAHLLSCHRTKRDALWCATTLSAAGKMALAMTCEIEEKRRRVPLSAQKDCCEVCWPCSLLPSRTYMDASRLITKNLQSHKLTIPTGLMNRADKNF